MSFSNMSTHTNTSNSHFPLTGRVAVVTGAGQAIGQGIAKRLIEAGAKVAIFDLNAKAAEETAAQLGAHALAVPGDVTVEADIKKAIHIINEKWGQIDILVNNAGIVGKTAPLWELSREEYEKVLSVNVIGPFLFCKHVVEGMMERKYGRIINVASIAGKEGNPTLVPYSASKAAVINMTKALAKEVLQKIGKEGSVTVNCISPAVIQTPILETIPQATIDYMVSKIPMGRTGKIEEIAALVHYLASAEASFCTGQCYDITLRAGGGRATF